MAAWSSVRSDSSERLPGFNPGSIITGHVTLDKFLYLSGAIYLMGLLRGLREWEQLKDLEQYKA